MRAKRIIRRIRIDRKIGEGSYNLAFLTRNNTVLRIAPVRNQATLEVLQRGDAIQRLLSLYADTIGPCLLKIITPGRVLIGRTQLPEAIFNDVQVSRFLSNTSTFYASEIELAAQGDMYRKTATSKDLFDQFFFMLLWFFHVARSETGFFHHDLKPNNILVKELEQPTTFAFIMDNDKTFVFPDVIFHPLIADFDFASVAITNENDRRSAGTAMYIPSDHLLVLLTGQRLTVPDLARTYDLFAIGQTLLQFCIGPDIFLPMQTAVLTYFQNDFNGYKALVNHYRSCDASLEEPERGNWWEALLFQAVLEFIVGTPHPWCAPLPDVMRHYHIITADRRVVAAQERAKAFPSEIHWLKNTLMSRADRDREPRYSMYDLLDSVYFSRFKRNGGVPVGSTVYHFDERGGLELEPTREMHRDPLLCAQCKTDFTFTQCQCCDVPVCGAHCQMELHKE